MMCVIARVERCVRARVCVRAYFVIAWVEKETRTMRDGGSDRGTRTGEYEALTGSSGCQEVRGHRAPLSALEGAVREASSFAVAWHQALVSARGQGVESSLEKCSAWRD